MKTVIALLVLVAFSSAAQVIDPLADRSISSTIVDVIEGVRDQMPCGFPSLGIPPLAPFKLYHHDINIDYPALSLKGSVDNFVLNGLNDFDVAEMKVNAILSRVTYRFVFRNINVDTTYDFALMLQKAGFTINMVGAGRGQFAIKDMQIWGTLKYNLGLLSGKLTLKSLEVRTHIGEVESDIEGILGEGVVNHRMNDILAEAVEIAVNENEDMLAETIENVALPVVNSVLDEFKLTDLVAIVGGGGEDTEKVACLRHPTQ